MRCSKCGAENPDRAKFCEECASPLMRRCPSCDTKNSPTAKFCIEWAKPLESAGGKSHGTGATSSPIQAGTASPEASLQGERKTVTVLSADIRSSTELEQDLDPEDARAIIDPALKLMIDAVHHYGGHVAQSTGDGIFAMFGAPIAHEDHPQRALHAALRIQGELKRYSSKVVAEGGIPMEVRIGATTGEVVARSIRTGDGRTEYAPVGHTANLAARVQAVAPTGSIAVSETTRKLCEGYFSLRPLGPTRVKGVSERVNVYEVTGLGSLRTRLQRAAGQGLTKFVGREREMDALKLVAELARQGHGQIAAAVAEPGVGKSRVVHEFKDRNQSGCMVLEAVSFSHGKATAYLPVIDLLRNYFGIEDADDARKRREKVIGKLLGLDRSLEDALPYLFGLLGLIDGDDPLAGMDAQIRRRRTLEALKRILLRESLKQPLMVIFEDLQWIDEETQAFLNLLGDSIGTAKILLLVNYRPEYSHQWNSKTYYTQLRLDPLGKESASEMLDALLGVSIQTADGPLASLKRLIIEKTEGTPLFMEEIIQALQEDGTLVRNGTVELTRPLDKLKIPPTVQAIIASRIDRLSPDAKDLLQTLAVMGREFPLSLIGAVVTKSDYELNGLLNELQLSEFIYEQPAVGDTEYIFKHALTQGVAYDSLLIERRKQLHERVGIAIESASGPRLVDRYSDLAHHFGLSANPKKAIRYLRLAGQQAIQRSAYDAAERALNQALNLLPRLPDELERVATELSLLTTRIPILQASKGFSGSEIGPSLEHARLLCERTGDRHQLFAVLWNLVEFQLGQSKPREALEVASRAMDLAKSIGDPLLLVGAYNALGESCFWLGYRKPAIENLEAVMVLYVTNHFESMLSLYPMDVWVMSSVVLAWAEHETGWPDQALKRSLQAVTRARELDHPASLAFALTGACWTRAYRREPREVAELAREAIALSTEHGFREWLIWGTWYSGWAAFHQGACEPGVARMTQAMDEFRSELGAPGQSLLLARMADARGQMGGMDEGLVLVQEGLELAETRDEAFAKSELHRIEGNLRLEGTAPDAIGAERCFRKAIEIAREQSGKVWELRAATSLARLLAKQGRRDEARAMLAEIYGWFTEGFDTTDLKDSKALLDELNA